VSKLKAKIEDLEHEKDDLERKHRREIAKSKHDIEDLKIHLERPLLNRPSSLMTSGRSYPSEQPLWPTQSQPRSHISQLEPRPTYEAHYPPIEHLLCPMAPSCSATFASVDDLGVHFVAVHQGMLDQDNSDNGNGNGIVCKARYQKEGKEQTAEIHTTLKSSLAEVGTAFEEKQKLAKGSIRMLIYKGKTERMDGKTLEGINYKEGEVVQILVVQ